MIRRISLVLAPLALLTVLAAGCGGGGGGGSSSLGKDELGVVGKTPITRAQFDEVVNQAQASYKTQNRPFPKVGSPAFLTLQGQIMNFLVERADLAQKATELGVTVSDKQVADRLTQIKKQYFKGDEKKYQAAVKAQGVSDAVVREDVRSQLVSDGLKKKVTASIKITDKDVSDYYKAHPELYSKAASRDVRHILVKDKATADKIYTQLKGGGDFAALAKKYSIDPGSKNTGGKLTISKGQTVAPFDKVAFSLKTNELSKPVKSQFGWHVIQALTDIKPATKTPLDTVKAAITQTLLTQEQGAAFQTWLTGIQAELAKKSHFAAGYEPTSTSPTATAPTTTG